MSKNLNNDLVKELNIYALATDPVYIGTGGYTIGRVDNTIVRDPTTNVPKIPGTSLAGTWRYYVVLEAYKYFANDELKVERSIRKGKDINEIFSNNSPDWIKAYRDNKFMAVKCAGQDDIPNASYDDMENIDTGHCGRCIVCKGFGFSKKDVSWQGMFYFSDLQILFFPVFTRLGTKWITSAPRLKGVGLTVTEPSENKIKTSSGNEGYLNLGWLNLEVENGHDLDKNNLNKFEFNSFKLNRDDIVVVPESLFPQIVNSNLEVRTSVSIDPITGAAKEGALFTSEAIPRGTIFYGNIRIFDKCVFVGIDERLKSLPSAKLLIEALRDSKHFYETLGIGGMTTRGFGRLKIHLIDNNSKGGNANESENGQ